MLRFLRQSWRTLALSLLLGSALRLLFILKFPHVFGDTLIYGDIAKNWLLHGVYGFSHPHIPPEPTWIRLPGYPAFLAVCFKLLGMEHYGAVMYVQLFFDLATCLFVADLARRMFGDRAGRIAFLAAALCPFTSNYVAAPMPEVLSIFFSGLSLWFAWIALDHPNFGWRWWAGCGTAVACAVLLRPDGGILLIALALVLGVRAIRLPGQRRHSALAFTMVAAIALTPLVPWTIRNWRTFHRFQPLAPRYASDPQEFVPRGFNHWVRTWMAEYVSVEDIYWQMPGGPADAAMLPSRAFDTEAERDRTQKLFDEYAKRGNLLNAIDGQFEQLARERVLRHPFRYYIRLPLMRIADMWFRPRTENLPLDSRWWQDYRDDPQSSAWAALLGVINLAYVLLAAVAVFRHPRPRFLLLLLGFVFLRSAFLGTLESPEPRYTLECYPLIAVLASGTLASLACRRTTPHGSGETLQKSG